MLLAAAAAAGAETLDLGVARDTEGHLEGALAAAIEARADVLITSGLTRLHEMHVAACSDLCGFHRRAEHCCGMPWGRHMSTQVANVYASLRLYA